MPPAFSRLLLFCVSVLMALPGCSGHKASPQEAAQLFFQQVSQGDAKSAYDDSAFAFQAQQSLKAFEVRLQELGLAGAATRLTPGESNAKTARIDVEVTPKTGDKFPLILTLQVDAGAWRVFSLRSPRSVKTGLAENRFTAVGKPAAFNDAVTQRMPDGPTIQQLLRDSMRHFSDAVAKRSFTDFYNFTSAAWQAQLTETQLQRAFQAFIDKEVNLAGVTEISPVLDPMPMIGTDGLLVISGSYPTQPYQVFFSLKFVYELPDWKLFGLDVYLRKADEGPPTPGAK